jgi:hypothetical protein
MALAGGRSICRSVRPPSSGASCTDGMRTAYGRGCATRYLALLATKTSALIHDTGLRLRWPLACNGIYLNAGDLSLSSLAVTPLAGHVAGRSRGWPH